MSLIVDTASSSRRLSGDELRRWADDHTAFISSEMSQLGDERDVVRDALRVLGMSVIMFEDLGGRDEDAVTAYLDGVARSDVYIGIVGDCYGRMQPSHRSATHDEYLHARRLGKRISVWLAADDRDRQGHAVDFVQEIEVFHTTGRFTNPTDLADRITQRMAELAADDEAPWVKVGDAVFRASLIRDVGDRIEIEAEVRDRIVSRYLVELRPSQFHGSRDIPIATGERAGVAEIANLTTESRSASATLIKIEASIEWADGFRGSGAWGTSGYTAEDLTEHGLRAGLLGVEVPANLGAFGPMLETPDPLDELHGPALSEGSVVPIARLLLVEHLVGKHLARSIDQFSIGPAHEGKRQLSLTYTEARQAVNVDPQQRTIEGERSW
jgi:uncharacterized protein DUF4062